MKIKAIIVMSLVVIFSVLSGCSTYNPVNLQKKSISPKSSYYDFQPAIYVGDNLKYSLLNGDHGELTVVKIEPTRITGDNGRVVPLAELSFLERKDISTGKTAALVGGGVAATTVVLFLVGVTIIGLGTVAAITS
ncbi:hypothetical protein DLR11_21290 [Salmonella enterica subsp. salamae]|uniref:Phage-related lipoprotein n=1 Tax=Salmonella enterica subsp. salamae TaxID=59202 RepID=A0A5Y3V4N5_SALER|nr:hypothetical protein [Salmonella enterica subsp. salamae]EDK4684833.1 hypothetical protein [Salmonella enterica]EDS1445362.1 hypothetical protein [Salmonella enterica subsp. enterica serovar Enteritidis]HCM1918920.1 hypothetical protein [Salmonella enterica subsp. salamae serovar 28:r:e,n,z15]ECI3454300.1 hypothetical protein [Salmonella enterica subsp. salamae]